LGGARLGARLLRARRRKRRRRLTTDPDEARRRALAQGLSRAEAEQAAEQALVNARQARRAVEEEDRIVAGRDQQARSFWSVG
jgi:hypothetical protein